MIIRNKVFGVMCLFFLGYVFDAMSSSATASARVRRLSICSRSSYDGDEENGECVTPQKVCEGRKLVVRKNFHNHDRSKWTFQHQCCGTGDIEYLKKRGDSSDVVHIYRGLFGSGYLKTALIQTKLPANFPETIIGVCCSLQQYKGSPVKK